MAKYLVIRNEYAFNQNSAAFVFVVQQIGLHSGATKKHAFHFGICCIRNKLHEFKVSKSEIRKLIFSQRWLLSYLPTGPNSYQPPVSKKDAKNPFQKQRYKFSKNGFHILRVIIQFMKEINRSELSEQFLGRVNSGNRSSYWKELLISDLMYMLNKLYKDQSKKNIELNELIEKLKGLNEKC